MSGVVRRAVLCGGVLVASAGLAQADLVNGGFETGDLTGWSVAGVLPGGVGGGGGGARSGEYPFPPGIPGAASGTYYGTIEPDITSMGTYATLSQGFSTPAGGTIAGDWVFKTYDYFPFDDDGYLRILDSLGGEVAVLLTASVSSVGDNGTTGWLPWSYTFTSGGNYTLEAGVRNGFDFAGISVVGLDSVHLVSVPIPTSAWLGLAGLLGVGVVVRRRRMTLA